MTRAEPERASAVVEREHRRARPRERPDRRKAVDAPDVRDDGGRHRAAGDVARDLVHALDCRSGRSRTRVSPRAGGRAPIGRRGGGGRLRRGGTWQP